MTQKWVCDTCLVPNDVSDKTCSCCGSDNKSSGATNLSTMSTVQPVKQQKVVLYNDDRNRIRQKYSVSDLKYTNLFVVGSSEVDQLPTSCCDKTFKTDSNELQQLYECSLPTPLLSLPKVRVLSVSCGALHTALVTSNGHVYTFGCNDMGALGREPNSDPSVGPLDSEPFLVDIKVPVKKTTCGDNHTLFLTYMGVVYFTGSFKDSDGPIGVADYTTHDTLRHLDSFTHPVKVPCQAEGSSSILDIASGENHCVLLCQGGNSMYTFGSNEFSQLLIWDDEQIQNRTENDVDLSVKSEKKLLLTWPQHRTLGEMLNTGTARQSESQENDDLSTHRTRSTKRGRSNEDLINQVFTGNCTTFFQTKSLRLYGAGRNAQGEVGVGSDEVVVTRPREITFFRGAELTNLTGGQFFTMALVNDYVFTWGQVNFLGIPNDSSAPTPFPLKNNMRLHDEELLNSVRDEEYLEDGRKRRKVEEPSRELDNLDVIERLLLVDYDKKYKKAVKYGKATSPLLLNFPDPIRSIFNGSDSLFAINFEGDLFSWGSGQNYVLGNGKDYFYQDTPQMVPSNNFSHCRVSDGAGGSQHTVFLAMKKRGGLPRDF